MISVVMGKNKECTRCGGRGRLVDLNDQICFVCHGKGNTNLTQKELEEYFAQYGKIEE